MANFDVNPPSNNKETGHINLLETKADEYNGFNMGYNDKDEILSKLIQLDVKEFSKYIKKKENEN